MDPPHASRAWSNQHKIGQSRLDESDVAQESAETKSSEHDPNLVIAPNVVEAALAHVKLSK